MNGIQSCFYDSLIKFHWGLPFFQNNDAGTVIFQVYAVDNDFGDNGIVDYSLLAVDDYELFSIDPQTGDLTILLSTDRETKQSYQVCILSYSCWRLSKWLLSEGKKKNPYFIINLAT